MALHHRSYFSVLGFAALFLAALPRGAWAEAAISDNSFLVEEAYNQEPGVVQHVATAFFTGADRGDVFGSFTQEWPLWSQRHQGSFTLTGAALDGDDPNGLGDLFLNYRLQLGGTEAWALAPRVSLVVPVGDEDEGLGAGSWGAQTNLPLSVEIGEHLAAHANVGFTWLPDAKRRIDDGTRAERDLEFFNAAASLVGPIDRKVQLLLESVLLDEEEIAGDGSTERATAFTLSPGVRAAIDTGGVQIVPGFAVPVTWIEGESETSFFLYLSVEHGF